MDEYEFNLTEAIEDKDDLIVAKAIMERVSDNDELCDIIVHISTMLSNEDKQWLVNTISKFITKKD